MISNFVKFTSIQNWPRTKFHKLINLFFQKPWQSSRIQLIYRSDERFKNDEKRRLLIDKSILLSRIKFNSHPIASKDRSRQLLNRPTSLTNQLIFPPPLLQTQLPIYNYVLNEIYRRKFKTRRI